MLTGLSQINAEDLVRANELGRDFNFEPGLKAFERTLKLFKDLNNSNLDNVSYNILSSLLTHAKMLSRNLALCKNSRLHKIQTHSMFVIV